MSRGILGLVWIFLLALASAQEDAPRVLTDAQVKQLIIRQSITAYSGSCPCPFNVDRAGLSCGARSAYSRPGGASPIYYAKQVTDAHVKRYREQNKV